MTNFLQRLQLGLWAVAIIIAVVFQLTSLTGSLAEIDSVPLYVLNLISIVLLLLGGYFAMAQRNHRLARIIVVNATVLCTELLYFLLSASGTTVMYCFLISLLLSIYAYPLEPDKEEKEETPDAPAESVE